LANKKVFDKNKFKHNKFQALVSENLLSKKVLPAEHLEYLKNQALIDKVNMIQNMVSDTLSYYRNQSQN